MQYYLEIINEDLDINIVDNASSEDVEILVHQVMKGDKGETGTLNNVTASVDANTGTPQVVVTYAGGNADFAFKNLKGNAGQAGPNIVSSDTNSNITGLLKGANGKVAQAVEGTDYIKEHQSLAEYRKASAQDVIDANFVTKAVSDLTNYYLKTDTYTQAEVNALISAITRIEFVVASVLPTASASTINKIYLIPSASQKAQNVKDEFITIDNGAEAQTRYTWEQIGSTAIDLSNYYTKSETDSAISGHHDSTKQDKIDSAHKLSYTLLSDTPSIPSKTSELTNDSGFLTSHQSLDAYRTSAAQDVIDASKASITDLESGALVPALAKNIKGLQADNTAKFIRRTTAGSVDVEAGVSELDEIKGNSIVWNQLVDETTSSVTIPSGHKYLFRNSTLSTTSIITSDEESISVVGGSDVVIDLTQMFGAGNEPSTVAEFEALYGKSYYPYNNGQVLHNTVANFVTNGFNQMDSNGHFIAVNQPYQIVGTYSSITQHDEAITPDTNGIFTPSRGQVTVTGYDGTTCVHLVHSGDRNGQYEPHWESRLPLNLTTIKGKLNGTGNSVTIFPEGMCGVGSAYDSIVTNENGLAIGAWRRFGKVNMGSLQFNKYELDSNWLFYATVPNGRRGIGYESAHFLLNLYSNYPWGRDGSTAAYGTDKTASWDATNNQILIKDSTYSDAATFKAAMQGVYLYYELASPEYYVLDEPFETYAKVDDYGMEWIEPIEDNQGNPTTAPFSATIKYGINVKDTIKNLPHNYRTKEAQDVIDAGKQDLIDSTHKLDNSLVGLTVVTTNPATLEVCKLYDLGEQSSLALVLPSSASLGDFIIVDFLSGDTATTLSITSSAGMSEYDLVPETNKIYELYFRWAKIDSSNYGWVIKYSEATKATV